MSGLSLYAIPGTPLHDALRRDGFYASAPPASRTSTSREGPWQITVTHYATGEIDASISDADANMLARFSLAPGGSPAAIVQLARAADRIPTDDATTEAVVRSADAGMWCRRDRHVPLAELAAHITKQLEN